MDGYRAIVSGDVEVMVVGGSDEMVNPPRMHTLLKQGSAPKKKETPGETSRPFIEDRDGVVAGEGSGILILEELEHALKRNAKIYAELASYGCAVDAKHLSIPAEDGNGTYRAMQNAIRKAGISPQDIDHINAHASGSPMTDQAEAFGIASFLQNKQELMDKVTITANKSAFGHCVGAAGSIETIFTILSLNNDHVPPILNLDKPMTNPKLNFVKDLNHHQKIRYAIKKFIGLWNWNCIFVDKTISVSCYDSMNMISHNMIIILINNVMFNY